MFVMLVAAAKTHCEEPALVASTKQSSQPNKAVEPWTADDNGWACYLCFVLGTQDDQKIWKQIAHFLKSSQNSLKDKEIHNL